MGEFMDALPSPATTHCGVLGELLTQPKRGLDTRPRNWLWQSDCTACDNHVRI